MQEKLLILIDPFSYQVHNSAALGIKINCLCVLKRVGNFCNVPKRLQVLQFMEIEEKLFMMINISLLLVHVILRLNTERL